MISIITAIRDLLPMNRLYVECLKKYTKLPFELIIIDNASTDGSREFFIQQGANVIVNDANYSYPYCQNLGIMQAKYNVMAFFNNDLIVSPGWDEHLLKIMEKKKLDVVSFATNDRVESVAATSRLKRQWKWISYPLEFLMGTSFANLKRMHRLMYGDWEKFTTERRNKFDEQIIEGFSGSCIVSTRNAIDKIGRWDERIQAADFDLYLRTKKRSIEQGDMNPLSILLGIYFHHYGRLTLRGRKHSPFADKMKLITLEEKWGSEMESLLADISR